MKPSLISYAQNFEDVLLWRAVGDIAEGRYIDIGAQSPQFDSVSRVFFDHGWHGIHVEPTPRYAQELREQREGDVVLQCAIAEEAGVLRFYEIPDSGLSTLDEALAHRHADRGFPIKTITVPAITLDALLEQAGEHDIHWMKIDVEGAERSVLAGWRGTKNLPWVVVVESTSPLSQEPNFAEWEPLLLAKGYRFAYFDGLNRFYVSPVHVELESRLQCGPNVFDNFSLSSHSAFCAAVNLAYHDLEVRSAQREGDLVAQVQRAQAEAVQERKLLEAQLAQRELDKQEFAAHTQRFAELEQRYAHQQQAYAEAHQAYERSQQALFEQRDEQAQERNRHQAELMRIKQEMTQLSDEIAVARVSHAKLQHQHRQLQEAKDELMADLVASEKRSQAHAQQAHRWWVEAESLRARLLQMLGSHSWKMTAPLRSARRKLSGAAHAISRYGKQWVKPKLVAAMRASQKRPGLHRWARPQLARFPQLERRLVDLAIREQLPSRHVPSRIDRPLPVEPRHATTYLDKRARSVLADLQRAAAREEQA